MKRYLALFLVLVMIFSVSGCDFGKGKPEEPLDGDGMANSLPEHAGFYPICGFSKDGTDYDYETSVLSGLGGYYLRLNEDGTCELQTGKLAATTWTGGIIGTGKDAISYTYDNGRISIDAGNGIVLYFSANKDSSPAGTENTDSAAQEDTLSEAQKTWNGAWAGYMYFGDCTGTYEGSADSYFSCYMVVDLDRDGTGTFTMYNLWDEFASGTCEVVGDQLHSVSGTAFGADMQTDYWVFYPSPNKPHMVCMSDEITVSDADYLEYDIYLRPWGITWDDMSDAYVYEAILQDLDTDMTAGNPPLYGDPNPEYFASAAQTASSGSGTESSAPQLSGSTEDFKFSNFHVFTISYPSDTWEIDESAIWPTVRSKDGNVKISIVTFDGASNLEEKKSYFEEFSDKEEYSYEEGFTFAGYPAVRMTYYEDWYGHVATYIIWFNDEKVDGLYGIQFTVYAEDSMASATSDTVCAILNSLKAE